MARFRQNQGLAKELGQQAEHRTMLRSAAESVRRQASTFAAQAREPWMKRQSQTIVVDESDEIAVVNTDYGGHLAEWGSKNNPAHAPLRRAVRAAGLALREG